MKYGFVALLLFSIALPTRGALSEDCSTFYIYDLSLIDLGTASLTDGQSQAAIGLTQPLTYAATVCFTPTGIWIAGQFAPAGPVATLITLSTGQKVRVEWVTNGVEVTDASEKAATAVAAQYQVSRTALHTVGRYNPTYP